MTRQKWSSSAGAGLLLMLFALCAPVGANAQTVTGTIRGRVMDESGSPVAAATITARNPASGVARSAISSADGMYVLAGLQPGSYEITVNMIGYSAEPRTVRVLIGQSLNMDMRLAPQAIAIEGINVVGTRAVETRTSEIATNVTEEQLEALPQSDRNFLNLAGLAPGVSVSRDEQNKTITAGGLPSTKINVFVDGASFKNDMLEGGLHGQDAARGNPFPQIALQEFRVLTQNFKAEYQRAASAVITATTKSGTNEFKAEGFVIGQNKQLTELNPGLQAECDENRKTNPNFTCAVKPEYEKLQLGISVGGPIVRDKAHYFFAYEGNYQNRQALVDVPANSAFANATLINGNQPTDYEGTFDQPFRSTLGVAKISLIPGANQTLDLSWNGRFETDKRNFGGTTSFESAENVAIRYNVITLQHSLTRGHWLNQINVSGQRSTWNPTAVNDNQTVGFNYENVIRIGARDTEQDFTQDRISLRDDVTRYNIEWNGDHVIKLGGNVDFLNYKVAKRFNGVPLYTFNPAVSLTVPIRAVWGVGDPGMDESNVQFGAYLQDDWQVSDKLLLNLGIRWDAETNQFNNEWVTPDSIRTKFAGLIDPAGRPYSERFTDGNDRPMFLGAFQPRVGFAYDFSANGRTVLHGGYGLYYDREVWNHLLDERFRLQWAVRTFQFAAAGETDKIPWDPSYLTEAGLQSIINSADPRGPTSEVFLLENDTEPPHSHQFSLGLRQAVGPGIVLGAQYRGVRGRNILSWYCGMPHPVHGYCEGGRQTAGLTSDPVLSTDEGETKYDAVDLTAEKPFTSDSRWGMTFSYTNQVSKQKGDFFFTLDHPGIAPEDWPMRNSGGERHRITASGIVGLPYDFRLSGLAQWNSGFRFSKRDETAGWGPARVQVGFFTEEGEDFKQFDVRLEKSIGIPGQGNVGFLVEVINVFNTANYRGYDELSNYDGGGANAHFGQPWFGTADPGRRLQIGLNFNMD